MYYLLIVMDVMMFREFYTTVVANEVECHRFLVEKGLLKSAEDNASCYKRDEKMQLKRRKCRNGERMAIFRCPKRGCQTTRSARAGSRFFHFTDVCRSAYRTPDSLKRPRGALSPTSSTYEQHYVIGSLQSRAATTNFWHARVGNHVRSSNMDRYSHR